jgi:hypothetical protein
MGHLAQASVVSLPPGKARLRRRIIASQLRCRVLRQQQGEKIRVAIRGRVVEVPSSAGRNVCVELVGSGSTRAGPEVCE